MADAILTFDDVEFDVVDIHNVPWLRGPQIGDALGYIKEGRVAIDRLYKSNADEFSEDMTQILDLPTAGGIQPVRIFSPRGCYLLAMLARTERAKAFRQWVLDVLEGRVLPHEARPTTVGQRISLHKLRSTLLRELQQATAPGLRTAIHQQLQQVSRLLAMPCPSMDEIGRTLRQPGLQGI